MPFETTKALIPVGADDILKIWYKDYMTFPPKEEQVPRWGLQALDLRCVDFNDSNESG